MKQKTNVLIWGLILMLCSCETKEHKIKEAEEIVTTFINNLWFDNYVVMYDLYPSFRNVNTYWKLKNFNITNTTLNNDIITIIGNSADIEVFFEVKKIRDKYIITKSKGLSSDFNTNLYKYCKNIGCIGQNSYDEEISRICMENKNKFNELVRNIKEAIENSVWLLNHTVTKNYGYTSGEITVKNNSRFTIPKYSYNLYVNYTDKKGENLFTSKHISNYESIPYGENKTIHVFELNSSSFQKIGISLKIIDADFIEEIISQYAEGYNCIYSNNL